MTLTRDGIAERLQREIGLSHKESRALVDQIVRHMSEGLIGDGAVEIGDFGTLYVQNRAARYGRDMRRGCMVPIPARKVVRFSPGKGLKRSGPRHLD